MSTEILEAPPAGQDRFLYQEVADRLRTEIAEKYRPGDLLLSERLLAARYSVNVRTVRQARGVLGDEALVARHPRRGSVVVDRKAVGEFAVVIRPGIFHADTHPYYTLTYGLLVDAIHARNSRWRVRLHHGKVTATSREFPATLDLLEPDILRNLRGVFAFHHLHEVGAELGAKGVPIVTLGPEADPRVFVDSESKYNEGLAHLKQAGCKTVGMIWTEHPREKERGPKSQFFVRAAETSGLEVRPEWMAPEVVHVTTEQQGYELMTRLWNHPARPDGILVDDDVLCRGVLRAALHHGLEFPRDMRLVTYANRGIALPYHKPVSRVEFDPAEQVRVAVEMMLTLMEGRTPPATIVDLPLKLIEGETT